LINTERTAVNRLANPNRPFALAECAPKRSGFDSSLPVFSAR